MTLSERQKPVRSHFTCCHFHFHVLLKSIPKPPQHLSAPHWHLWRYETPECKTALTRCATLIVCANCTQLNLSSEQWLMKACRSVQTHHEAHKYLVLQGISRMHSYESLLWKSGCAVSALTVGCRGAAGEEENRCLEGKANLFSFIVLMVSFISTVTILKYSWTLCWFKEISPFQKLSND